MDEIQGREVGFFRLHYFNLVLIVVLVRSDVVKYGAEFLLAQRALGLHLDGGGENCLLNLHRVALLDVPWTIPVGR